jgi:hypothetical protein
LPGGHAHRIRNRAAVDEEIGDDGNGMAARRREDDG